MLQIPSGEKNIHKKRRAFRESNGYFMNVTCNSCNADTICYSHSQTNIKCSGCSNPILRSAGGKAKALNSAKCKVLVNEY